MQMVETRNVSWSIVAHALVLLIAAFGLPALLPKTPDPEPMVMSIDLLPVSEISNVKPSDQPIQKAQNAPAKVTPTPPAPPKVQPTPPQPAPTPPPPPKTFDPDEGAPVKDKIKPVEKKPDPPKPTIDQKQTEDFNKLLADMKLKADKQPKTPPAATPGTDKTTVPENKTKSDKPYDDSAPVSQSEKDAIASQFIPCWTMPAGSKDANKLIVNVRVQLQPDGTVITATVASNQLSHYNSDTFFRAAADAAVRAVYKCSPLKNLPADKYNSWKDMEVGFNPKDLS